MSEDDLECKREYNIRQREKEYEQRQRETLAKKNHAFEQRKAEEAAKESKHLAQQRAKASDVQTKKKTAQVENEYRERCRDVKMQKKQENWKIRSFQQIQQIIDDASKDERDRQALRQKLKEQRNERLQREAYQRGLQAHKLSMLEGQRELIFSSKEQMRREKELMRIEKLKAEQRAELEEAMYSQSSVPLKSTLVASLTATPSVSQLLCAFKDQMEDYEDLKECDLETRAKHKGLPLFQDVKLLKEAMDASRHKPPEPIPTDAPGMGASKKKGQPFGVGGAKAAFG